MQTFEPVFLIFSKSTTFNSLTFTCIACPAVVHNKLIA